MRASEGCTSDGVRESLWLRFGRGRSSDCGAGLSRGGCGGKKVDFVRNGAAKISEGFADVGRVVVGFIGVLGAS